jgi:hypothetical protein
VQLLNAFVVGVLTPNLAQLHNVFPVYRKGIMEAVEVPVVKQRHVKTYMGCCQTLISFYERKKCVEMADVVHKV